MNGLDNLIIFKLAPCYHSCIEVNLYDNDACLGLITLLRLVMLNSISTCKSHICIGLIGDAFLFTRDSETQPMMRYLYRLCSRYTLEPFKAFGRFVPSVLPTVYFLSITRPALE